MKKVLISAKVVPEMVEEINETGFRTSDIIKAGVMMFLSLSREDQGDHISRVIKTSNALRAGARLEWLRMERERNAGLQCQGAGNRI